MTTTANTIQAAPNKPINGVNVITRDNSSPAGRKRNIDAVRVAAHDCAVNNAVADTQGETSSTINAAGSLNAKLSGITQAGGGRALTFSSATGLIADLIQHKSGLAGDYCVYAGLDGTHLDGPVDCKILRADLEAKNGREHSLRIHKFRNLQIGDDKLSLAGLNYAVRIIYNSPYNGAAMTFKEGNGLQLLRVWTDGPSGWGPNEAEIPPQFNPGNPHPGDPHWAGLRTIGVRAMNCYFGVRDRFMHFQAGCSDFIFGTCEIHANTNAACLQIDGARGPNGEWPIATGIQFANCKFFGASLLGKNIDPATAKRLLAGFSFLSCTLNGKPLNAHGET